MQGDVLLFCEFLARSSPYYVSGMELDSPERTLWLHVIRQVLLDIAMETPKKPHEVKAKAEALRYIRFDHVEEALGIIGVPLSFFKRALHCWEIHHKEINMLVTSAGIRLAHTYEHTWEELEAKLHAGEGVVGLQGCIQNIPDFKCDTKTDIAGAKAAWLFDVPYAYQAGKNVPARVYANWQQHSTNYNQNKTLLTPEIPTMDVSFTPPKFTWSYSALNDFENCSLAYAHKRFYRDVTTPDTEATIDGTRKHAAFEKYLKGEEMFDSELELIKPWLYVADAIKGAAAGGELLVEHQICLTEQLKPTDWFGADAWGRGVIDVAVIRGDRANILDWKAGKVREDPTQLKTFCTFLALTRPEIQHFTAKNIYLKDVHAGAKIEVTRKELLPVLQGLLERVARMRAAWDSESWQARPSGLCRQYCYVKACAHCGVGGRR